MAVTNCSRTCRYCAKTFVRTGKGQPTKYCSIECRDRAQWGWKGGRKTHSIGAPCAAHGCDHASKARGYCQAHYHRALKGRDVNTPVAPKNARLAKPCACCGAEMWLTPCHAERKTYCSLACAGKARRSPGPYSPAVVYKRWRRERIREGDCIDAAAVFWRDKWRCHLCGIKTPEALRGTLHPKAPELDHIVALADGGTHTWGNVACACRKCNGAKGARSVGQLGLDLAA